MRVAALVVLFLPALAWAATNFCSGFIEPPTSAVGYNSYRYSVDNDGFCGGADLVCEAEIPVSRLMDRTWFITNNVEFHGATYPPSYIQQFNVECPRDSFLHLYPQRLQTEGVSTSAPTCEDADFVRVTNPEIGDDGEEVSCGGPDQLRETELFNGGLGRIVTNGNASVEFCTNNNGDVGFPTGGSMSPLNLTYTGFVIRATCVDPGRLIQPGCVDFQFYFQWDREYFDSFDRPFNKPETASIPHKRSASKESIKRLVRKAEVRDKRMAKRFKKFFNLQAIELGPGQTVTYANQKFTVDLNDGSLPFCPDGKFFCVETHSEFLGTRRFYVNSPITFTGPGKLELDGKIARVFYTIDETSPIAVQTLLLPGAREMAMVNRIYEYIYNYYVDPMPVTAKDMAGASFPLPSASKGDEFRRRDFPRFKSSTNLGFLQETFTEIMDQPVAQRCERGLRIRAAPLLTSTIDRDLLTFCRWMWYSCNPIIQTACRELINLDPSYSG